MTAVYIDTSAALKQLLLEPERASYLDYLEHLQAVGVRLTSSLLLDVELARVSIREGLSASWVDQVLGQFVRRRISSAVVALASMIPFPVRALDAIHLATAAGLGTDLVALVTYDQQMIRAARRMGLPVVSPGASNQ